MTCHVDLLDIGFDLEAECSEDIAYIGAFMDAYLEPSRLPCSERFTVKVQRESVPVIPLPGSVIPIHRTKHPYWSFDGVLEHVRPRTVAWPSRGVRFEVDSERRHIVAAIGSDTDSVMAGEAVFHAMRGIALACRRTGSLIHASAVVSNGRAIAFSGDVMAGKTTLLAEAAFRLGLSPLTNDRLLIADSGGACLSHSWPSYASFCEGTLLNFPALARAAQAYEEGHGGYTTVRWPAPLRPVFNKTCKRFYPMRWLVDAGVPCFAASAPLHAVVFVRLIPGAGEATWELIESNALSQQLRAVLFPPSDHSFLPWHGLGPNSVLADPDGLAGLLIGHSVSAWRLSIPIDLADFPSFLDEVFTHEA
jgi:hypothetical protein